MSDIKLFRLSPSGVVELEGGGLALERSLQTVFERNLENLLGVRFLASEYRTTNGRIDSLGLDENGCPVIVEYKRASNENVINQGLFYLDWLMDHRRDFEWLVMERLTKEEVARIGWSAARLICVASDFTRYDEHAVKQMGRNIELVRYRRFEGDLLLLELVTASSGSRPTPDSLATEEASPRPAGASTTRSKYITECLPEADAELKDVFEATRAFLLALGDDVRERTLKYYFAFTRLRNFACIEIKPTQRKIIVYVKVDPSTVDLKPGFTRDVTR